MKRCLLRLLPTLLPTLVMTVMVAALAHGQGGATSSIWGVVVDATSGALPGAAVVVQNDATKAEYRALTAHNGTFSIPALDPGTYTVTVSLPGFKTFSLREVKVSAATPATVRATLEVGKLEETLIVEGGADIIQTQSSAIATTLDVKQISNLPLTSRNALDFITFMPGVSTPGGNRDSIISGLPQSTINITIDGISAQDNFLKTTDGFFARLSPRLDAVEEVTITTAADSGAQGAVQIQFTTRSGSNDYRGSVYHYFRHHALNANTWFNNRKGLPRAELVQNQPGFRLGGPIIIPGLWNGRNKGFFFVNYEEFRQLTDVTRDRIILHPRAQQGIFRYNVTVGNQTQVREVDLLALAAANGHLDTLDPTVAKLLADIRGTTASKGSVQDLTDPLVQRYSFQNHQRALNRYPLMRLDFNLSSKHRLWGVYNYQHIDTDPDTLNNRDPNFPGFPVTGTQDSSRYSFRAALRSVLGQDMVNEFSLGGTGGATYFTKELQPGMWRGTLANQDGYQFNLNGACCGTNVNLTNASSNPTPASREASTKVLENTLNWVTGSHRFRFGASFTQADLWLRNQTLLPTLNFGIVSGDPADAIFNTTNFPGASSANLNAARGLYSILVGRISSMTANARLDEDTHQYNYLAGGTQRGRLRELDLFFHDAWHLRSNLTINYGLRYVLQFPFSSLNDSYTMAAIEDVWGVSGVGNLFQPGVLSGRKPKFTRFEKGRKAYNTDWNNLAPSLGFTWQPRTSNGFLRRILGNEGDTVIRAGYALAYNRPGMSDFSDVFGANPGVLINVDRTLALGNLGPLPLLFRDRDRGRLAPPSFAATPSYPLSDAVTGDVNVFEPNLQVPYAQTWSFGIQRAISRDMALEARYIGTRFLQGWTTYDYNEINILENGFLDEFKLAQANLQANIAAGRGSTFRYFGPATGTFPLPIFLAYFSGIPALRAGDASLYTSSLFGNNTFLNPLAKFYPQPQQAANALDADAARRSRALQAGLPANFLVANPDLLGGANITGNGAYTRYDAMELELRRRYANSLQFQANYVLSKAYESTRYSLRKPRVKSINGGAEGGVTHAFKANWIYELPFGRGKRFASNGGNTWNRIIGGWSLGGTIRIQSGRQLDFGNVRLVGFSPRELKKLFKLRYAENGRLYMLPQDIIDNTVKAFSVSATSPTGYGPLGPPSGRYFAPANGPDCIEIAGDDDLGDAFQDGFGDCGTRSLIVSGPAFKLFDLAMVKRIPLKGRAGLELRVELLNAFNHANFVPAAGISNNPDTYEVTALTGESTARNVQIIGRISF